jgi:uncharacterized protein (DUF302 family)
MQYVVVTTKSVGKIVEDLSIAVVNNKFGVLHVHNLYETMKSKGVEFDRQCQIVEICNPYKAKAILSEDISFSTLLPCRISVYEDGDVTKIATVMPTKLQCIVGKNKTLNDIAKDVEKIIVKIIDEAK